jgi:rhamnogalacturonyl hydrolase YesR
MSRVASALPDSMGDEKQLLVGRIKQIINSALKFMRGDGLFHDVIDDAESFVETNFAQMTAYTIYKCVAHGWLDESYTRYADIMREAALAKVDEYGLVTGACGAPDFSKSGESVEAQAFCILMEAARTQYKGK